MTTSTWYRQPTTETEKQMVKALHEWVTYQVEEEFHPPNEEHVESYWKDYAIGLVNKLPLLKNMWEARWVQPSYDDDIKKNNLAVCYFKTIQREMIHTNKCTPNHTIPLQVCEIIASYEPREKQVLQNGQPRMYVPVEKLVWNASAIAAMQKVWTFGWLGGQYDNWDHEDEKSDRLMHLEDTQYELLCELQSADSQCVQDGIKPFGFDFDLLQAECHLPFSEFFKQEWETYLSTGLEYKCEKFALLLGL